MSDKKEILTWLDSEEAEYIKRLIIDDIVYSDTEKNLLFAIKKNIGVEKKILLASKLIEQIEKEKQTETKETA